MNFVAGVQALVDEGVDFVIIGGWSAILHGSSSVTSDLDICYSRSSDNLKRVVAALTSFHPRLRGLPQDLPSFGTKPPFAMLLSSHSRQTWVLSIF